MATTTETVRHTLPTVEDPPYAKLTYGRPFYEACARHVKETFNRTRPYIIVSKTLSLKTPHLSQLQMALGPSLVGTWFGVPNHTPVQALLPIIEDMRAKDADCIITLGGGSISDAAKLMSVCLANDVHTVDDIRQLPRVGDHGERPTTFGDTKPSTTPVICVPISLSGGEYTRFAGATDLETHFKYQFTHSTMFASLVVLDPEMTKSTPMRTWFGSGVRSVDHCVEGYLSANPLPQTDSANLMGLPMLVDGLLKTKQDPNDLDARLQCQLGSNFSLTALYVDVMYGASHGIGHQLGPLGVPHGETSCILLPAVCKYNEAYNGERQKILKDVLLKLDSIQMVLKEASIDAEKADLGDILRAFFNFMGMPSSLKAVGVGADKLDALAQGCMNEVFIITNPRPMKTKEDVMEVLNMVLE